MKVELFLIVEADTPGEAKAQLESLYAECDLAIEDYGLRQIEYTPSPKGPPINWGAEANKEWGA